MAKMEDFMPVEEYFAPRPGPGLKLSLDPECVVLRGKRQIAALSSTPDHSNSANINQDANAASKKRKPNDTMPKSEEGAQIKRSVLRLNKSFNKLQSNLKDKLKQEMIKLESSLVKQHGRELNELRQEFESMNGHVQGKTQYALSIQLKTLKSQMKTLEAEKASLKRKVNSSFDRNASKQILHLERELEREKATNVDQERRHAAERAAGVMAVHAAEDNAKKVSTKMENEVECNASALVEIQVDERTKQLKKEIRSLKEELAKVEAEKMEADTMAKKRCDEMIEEYKKKFSAVAERIVDQEVEECKKKHDARIKALKDRNEELDTWSHYGTRPKESRLIKTGGSQLRLLEARREVESYEDRMMSFEHIGFLPGHPNSKQDGVREHWQESRRRVGTSSGWYSCTHRTKDRIQTRREIVLRRDEQEMMN